MIEIEMRKIVAQLNVTKKQMCTKGAAKMRTRFLASACAVGLMFFAGGIAQSADIQVPYQETAAAMPDASATVSLWVGGFFLSNLKGDGCVSCRFQEDAWGFGGDARGVYNFDNPGWALQFELMALGHESTGVFDSRKDELAAHLATGVHLINRRDGWAWGGLGALTHSSHVEQSSDSQHVVLGLEAAGFIGDGTVFGQVAGVWSIGNTTCDTEAIDSGIMGRIGGRYFFRPNTKLEGSIAGGTGEETSSSSCAVVEPDDWNWVQFAAEIEHKFASNPFSIFAAYDGDWTESDEKGDCCGREVWVHTVRIGGRISVGAQTLREQELYGAETFKFGQWAAPFMYHDRLDGGG